MTSHHETLASPPPAAPTRRRVLMALPLIGFSALAAMFYFRLGAGDPSLLPSALIGRPAPSFDLPPLPGLGPKGLSSADLTAGRVSVLNVFASWCVDCHAEHAALMALAKDPVLAAAGASMVGIAYKDDPDNARRYLGAKGNPYAKVGDDGSGRTGIDFGVYGVPETYVIKGDGTVAYKLVGGVTDATRPALLAAITAAAR